MKTMGQSINCNDFEKQFCELLEKHNLSKNDVINMIKLSDENSDSRIQCYSKDYNTYWDSFIA